MTFWEAELQFHLANCSKRPHDECWICNRSGARSRGTERLLADLRMMIRYSTVEPTR